MGSRDPIGTEAEDAATESVVLQQVLALHPTSLTVAELHRNGSLVVPTRAALRFDELLER